MQSNNSTNLVGTGPKGLPNHMIDFMHRRGITDEVMNLFNISIYDHPQIGECIKIPYSHKHSKYRRDPMSDAKPKYLYDAGGKVTLYGADKLREQGPLVITEGELDTLVCWSANIPAVSSTGGAMSFQEDWAITLAPYDVYLCFDNDAAGAEGMVKVLKYIPDAKVILFPNITGVKDVSDYVALGKDFRALMQSAKSYASIEEVIADKQSRDAVMLPTIFHEKYIEKAQEAHQRANRPVPTSNKTDAVLRAKDYPMDNLIDFKRNFACCPWHNEKSPSLKYYPKTNSAYCFGACGKAYDSIDAYMFKHSVGFMEAVKELNKLV